MRGRVIIVIVGLIVMAAHPAGSAESPEKEGEQWALLIGISKYQIVGELQFCREDAEALGGMLVERGGFSPKRVRVLTEAQTDDRFKPTVANVRNWIDQVCRLAEPEDSLLVFFSGHAMMDSGKMYLMGIDSNRAPENNILIEWVQSKLEASNASRKLLILDVCHAGSTKGVAGIAPSLETARDIVVVSSCCEGEISYVDDKLSHGVFTGRLIQALAGAADRDSDGVVTLAEAFSWVKDSMKDWSMETNRTQTPVMRPENPPAFALVKVVAPVSPAAAIVPGRVDPSPAAQPSSELRVPPGFRAAPGTTAEPYTNTGWAKEAVHEKTGIEMVFIPAGEFQMGSSSSESGHKNAESPVYRVRITKPFYLGKYEVTVGQWKKFADETGYKTEAEAGGGTYAWTGQKWEKRAGIDWRSPGFAQADSHPVTCVSSNDSQRFGQWGGFVLPTEAQWEYACRAGTTTAYHWGESPDAGAGWCNGADETARKAFDWMPTFSWSDGYVYTSPVGSFRANGWGLYDMHGNVWEWCADWYGDYPSGSVDDPQGPSSAQCRVLRGGSWDSIPVICRSATRNFGVPAFTSYAFGLRVARILE